MPATTGQIVRLLLGDRLRATSQFIYGDGTATAFQLSGAPIYSGSAASAYLVSGNGALSATGGTAMDFTNGVIGFNTALSANSAALVQYQWSVFSEDEIATLTGLGGNVYEMALMGVEWLQGDYARRIKWSVSQGPSVDPSMATSALAALWKQMTLQIQRKYADQGGLESWAETTQAAPGLSDAGFWH